MFSQSSSFIFKYNIKHTLAFNMRFYEPLAFAALVALVATIPIPFSEDGRSFSLDQYADQGLHAIAV
jgi:hypothetical protein